MLKNNYINELYHFYSDKFFEEKGLLDASDFFEKLDKLKFTKKKVKVNLFNDKLNKYIIKK